jgi:hypothetical protein
MLYVINHFLLGVVCGSLGVLVVYTLYSSCRALIDIIRLFSEEVKWLNKGIEELVVPVKKK